MWCIVDVNVEQIDGSEQAATNLEILADGNDIFNVTQGGIPVFINGGNPAGAVGDTLNVTYTFSLDAV